MKIHHIGYAVYDINVARNYFELLDYETMTEIVLDKDRNIYIQFIKHKESKIVVELIQPIESKNSPINNILKKIGDTPYHICYIVKDIENEIQRFKNNNFIIIDNPKPAIAIENNQVAFLYKKGIGIIELVEIKE